MWVGLYSRDINAVIWKLVNLGGAVSAIIARHVSIHLDWAHSSLRFAFSLESTKAWLAAVLGPCAAPWRLSIPLFARVHSPTLNTKGHCDCMIIALNPRKLCQTWNSFACQWTFYLQLLWLIIFYSICMRFEC